MVTEVADTLFAAVLVVATKEVMTQIGTFGDNWDFINKEVKSDIVDSEFFETLEKEELLKEDSGTAVQNICTCWWNILLPKKL